MSDQRRLQPLRQPDRRPWTAPHACRHVGVKPDARLAAGVPDPGLRVDVRRPARERRRRVHRPVERPAARVRAARTSSCCSSPSSASWSRSAWGINRISATAALGLFFVYAASLGITIGLIVAAYTDDSVVTRVPVGLGDVRCGGDLRHVTKRSLAGPRRDPVHGPDRAARGRRPEHLPAQRRHRLARSRSSASSSSRPSPPTTSSASRTAISRSRPGRWRRPPSSARCHLYLDFVNLFLFMLPHLRRPQTDGLARRPGRRRGGHDRSRRHRGRPGASEPAARPRSGLLGGDGHRRGG